MKLESQKEFAKKAFYAGIGAPVVAGRMAKDYADKLVARTSKISESTQQRFTELSKEGEKVTKQLRDADMVEEIQSRVDFEKVQDRVEKMRDQLEGALDSWRESFTPAAKPVEVKKVEAKKPAAKKAPATKPAAKKPATKAAAKPAVKKAPAKTAAKKTTTAKKTPAKTAATKTTATRKAPAKTAAKK